MPFSAKRSPYSGRPRFLSQSAICCIGGPLRISRYPFCTGRTESLPHAPINYNAGRKACMSAQDQKRHKLRRLTVVQSTTEDMSKWRRKSRESRI
jgi:hypothetical protein